MEFVKINRLKELAKNGVITHNGHFHSDDVLAAALLKIVGVVDDVREIKRVARVPNDFKGLVFDIGCGEFDHHQQVGAKCRADGTKYASFGLLWDYIGYEYIINKFFAAKTDAQNAVQKLDDEFVRLMDLSDNYGRIKYPNTLAHLIAAKNYGTMTPEERDEVFYKTANYISSFLKLMIRSTYEMVLHQAKACEIAEKNSKGFIVFDENADYIPREAFMGTNIRCFVKLCDRGTFNMTAIEPFRVNPDFINLPGCVQVYGMGAAFDTMEHAIAAAEKFVDNVNKKLR